MNAQVVHGDEGSVVMLVPPHTQGHALPLRGARCLLCSTLHFLCVREGQAVSPLCHCGDWMQIKDGVVELRWMINGSSVIVENKVR